MSETETSLYELEKVNEYRELVSSQGNLFLTGLLGENDNHKTQTDNPVLCKYVEILYGEDTLVVGQNVKNINTTSQQKLANDDGYNSHSSGESAPLLKIPASHKQDEAGYEVPDIVVKAGQNLPCSTNKKKLSIAKLWQRYSYEFKETNKTEDQKHYYEPSDSIHNYFLARYRYPAIHFIACLIFSIIIAASLSLVLHLFARINILLCIIMSVIVFFVVLVMFVTLSIRHALCIAALLIPSMFSSRTKLSVVIFIILLLVIGPIVGITEKLNIARTCRNEELEAHINNETVDYNLTENSKVYETCSIVLSRVYSYCQKMAFYLMHNCDSKSLASSERKLCNRTHESLCGLNKTALQKCSIKKDKNYKPVLIKFRSTNIISQIIIYIMPFLALLFVSEAYRYNKDYLTKKDEDNIYITPVLQSLDRERKNRGLNDFAVPLTRIEFQTYLIRKSFSLSRCEWLAIFKWIFIELGCCLLVFFVVLLDDWINSALENVLKLQCKYNFDYYLTKKYRNVIYTMLGFLAFLIVFQSYVLRLRSVICDYFYFDVVNIRSKHLYYKILHDRHSFARHVRRKVELMSEQKRLESKISFATKLYELLPQQVRNACLKLVIRSCMVCDSLTYYKTVECEQQSCKAHYCFECFVDAGQCCLRCQNTNSNNKPRSSSISVPATCSIPVSVTGSIPVPV